MAEKDYLTTSQAADLLSVSPDTVLKWVKAGKIKSYRTLGGHYRISPTELKLPEQDDTRKREIVSESDGAVFHQYCWEYLARGGAIKVECKDCVTYRSRARRCYQLKDLPNGLGCLNLMCNTACEDCEYYKLVNGQALNVLVVTENEKILRDPEKISQFNWLAVKFARNEYDAAIMVQAFRPDYIVVDCSFGKKRTTNICEYLFEDSRIPLVRIILSSRTREIRDYCKKEVFGWIKKPFDLVQLRNCISNMPG